MIGDENAQDLANAIDMFRERAFELSDIEVWKTIVESATSGAIVGAAGGPLGSAGGAFLGFLGGLAQALVGVCEQDKWHEIENFLSDLLNSPLIPKST